MLPHFLASKQPHELHILIMSSYLHPPPKRYDACNIEIKCYLRPKNCPKKVLKVHDEIVENQSSSIYT
jgi:hypothetical protein